MALGATFYTISNGAWNSTTVWSTDGITACWCVPSDDINGFDVVIRHTIEMTSDLTIKSGSSLTINYNAELTGVHDITVERGDLNSSGAISVNKIKVKVRGTATFDGPVTSTDDFELQGVTTINAKITITNGDFENKSGAITAFSSSSIINVLNGYLDNSGTVSFDSSCAEIGSGSLRNLSSGSVTGTGSITIQNGTITNTGSWSVGVDWCASGTGSGLPLSTKCASNNCVALSVLPIELAYFRGYLIEDKVILTWQTLTESNNEYFTIERMGREWSEEMPDRWEEIATIPGIGNSNTVRDYSLVDERSALGPQVSTIYYRLKQTDYDGKYEYSNIVAVEVEIHLVEDISIHPNPGTGEFTVEMYLDESQLVHLEVYDLLGRIIYKEAMVRDRGNMLQQIDLSGHAKGIYNLKLTAAGTEMINKTIMLY